MIYQSRDPLRMRDGAIARMPLEPAPILSGKSVCRVKGHKWKSNVGTDDFCTRCFKWHHPIQRVFAQMMKGSRA